MSDDSRDRLRARLNEPPPPLEATRAFLRGYASDADGIEEIQAQIAWTVAVNPRPITRAVQGIESLLADPPAEGTLAHLLIWDGNQVLADPSDEGAKAWLRDMAAYMRGVLGRQQEP